jgi:nicotinamidase-related amidase
MTKVLLVMDAQRAVVEHFGTPEVLERLVAAVGVARSAGVPVVFARVAFRSGFPEIAAANKLFSGLKANAVGQTMTPDAEETQIHPALEPRPDEPVVVKRRISAFSGSDLEVLLRAYGAMSLVLAGISTSGVVLSTFVEAADRDYSLTVLADACTDPRAELHATLVGAFFPQQATVVTVADWAAQLAIDA